MRAGKSRSGRGVFSWPEDWWSRAGRSVSYEQLFVPDLAQIPNEWRMPRSSWLVDMAVCLLGASSLELRWSAEGLCISAVLGALVRGKCCSCSGVVIG